MVIIVHKSVKDLGDTYKMSLCLSGLEFDSAGVDHLRVSMLCIIYLFIYTGAGLTVSIKNFFF